MCRVNVPFRNEERERVSFHYANEISIMIMHMGPIGPRDITTRRMILRDRPGRGTLTR